MRVLRRRDGRKGVDATVRSHDGDSVRLLFDNGSEADVPAGYDARCAVVRRPDQTVALPEDCVRHVAGFLSAKRASPPARWRPGRTPPGTTATGGAGWRRAGYEVAGAVASWRDVYRHRLSAEPASAATSAPACCRAGSSRRGSEPVLRRAVPDRRGALAHHRVHPHSWLGIDFDDEVWLNDRARGIILYRDDRKRELQVHAMEILEHRPISPTIGLCANFDM